MNLLFHDRSSSPIQPGVAGSPALSVRADGNLTLSATAITTYGLQQQQWVSLAQDTDTNTYYLHFGSSPGRHPYPLRAAKKSKSSLAKSFNSIVTARLLGQAFGEPTKSKALYLRVGAPLTHEAGALYPLQLDGAPVAQPVPVPELPAHAQPEAPEQPEQPEQPAAVTECPVAAPPVEAEPAPAATKTAGGKALPWSAADNDYLATHYATTPMAELCAHLGRTAAAISYRASTRGLSKQTPTASAPAPVATPAPVVEPVREDTSTPARKTFSLQARAEELTAFWYEREMDLAKPNELGEILNLLSHYPRDKRSFEMGVVLDRAEKEHTERLKGAGKGGNRG